MKWFDLSERNAKLERVRLGPGHHVLRLEVSSEDPVLEAATPETLEMHGWIAQGIEDGRISFENHRSVLKAADVAQSLLVFWSEPEIRDSHRPVETLSQEERIEGLKTRDMATMADFERDMDGVESDDLSRIKASILRAQQIVQKMENNSVTQPLGGRGLEIIATIAEHSEVELGVAAVLEVTRGHRNPLLHSVLESVLEENTERLPSTLEHLEALVPDYMVENVKRYVDQHMATDAIMTNSKGSRSNFAVGMMRNKVPLSALEAIRNSPKSTSELEAGLGMTVRRDKSLPTAQYRHSLIAMYAALEAMADALNRDPGSLMPGQESVVLRISRKPAADDRKAGFALSFEGDEEELGSVAALGVSAVYGGTFVHEIGHVVDQSFSLTAEERKDILEQSGVRGRVFRAVREALEADVIDLEDAAYLRSDAEIFARSFEASVVNRALRNGDSALHTIGGFSAGAPGDRFSPAGDYELTEKFLGELNKVLDQKQSLKHNKNQVVLASVEP